MFLKLIIKSFLRVSCDFHNNRRVYIPCRREHFSTKFFVNPFKCLGSTQISRTSEKFEGFDKKMGRSQMQMQCLYLLTNFFVNLENTNFVSLHCIFNFD